MKKFYFEIQIVDIKAKKPTRANEGDAGLDVYSIEDYILNPGERKLFDLGFKGEFPKGYVCDVRSKSGRALKEGLFVLNQPGTIDSSYSENYGVILFNSGIEQILISTGQKIAQLVFTKCKTDFDIKVVEELSNNSKRSGFGSSGLK